MSEVRRVVVDLTEDQDVAIAVAEADTHEAEDVPLLSEGGDGEDEPLPRRARENEDGTVTLTLRFPVDIIFRATKNGGTRTETVEELTFHKMTGADMRVVASAPKDAMIDAGLARCTRINPARMKLLVDRMDARDFTAATTVMNRFLGGGTTTGR